MSLKSNYDETNPNSIENYSKELIGKTFEDILIEYFNNNNANFMKTREQFNNPYRKGSLGNLVEEYYFGYLPNSSPEPDFPKAGVELKVSPYERTKTGKLRAGERLVLGMIPNNSPLPDLFQDSTAYNMLKLMLLVLYYRDRDLERVQYPIHYSQLVSINSEALKNDLEIIKSDYKIIVGKIKAGKAHELSEADTMYLGAATKGATAKKSLQPQYYNPKEKAKRRAFTLKQGYMSSFIRNYIAKEVKTYDIITEEVVSKETFEDIVVNKLKAYKGFSEDELRTQFDLIDSTSKDIFSRLTLKILNIYTETAEEFDKSNTQVKTIRLEEDGSIKESMSFSAISFLDFAEENWEESELYDYFSETRFLFVTFQKVDGKYCLHNAFFWHMPVVDLDGEGKQNWLDAQKVVREGVEFRVSGKRIFNNLPNSSKAKIFHLRPKANRAAYDVPSLGLKKGNINKDAAKLPNGDFMTKQCFWLNKDYIKKQIKKNMK